MFNCHFFILCLLFLTGCGVRSLDDQGLSTFRNSLGMQFKRVPSKKGGLVSVWETRNRDYAFFLKKSSPAERRVHVQALKNIPTAQDVFEADHPVIGVSFDDAKAFCGWLTKWERLNGRISLRQEYRLLNEEEARLLDSQKYSVEGKLRESLSTSNCNILGEESFGTPMEPQGGRDSGYYETGHQDGFPFTAPVGSFEMDSLGLFDVAGNAREQFEFNDKNSPFAGVFGDSFNGASFQDVIGQTKLEKHVKFDAGFRVVLDCVK